MGRTTIDCLRIGPACGIIRRILMAAVLSIGATSASAIAQTPAGRVSAVTGTVHLLRAGTTSLVTVNMPVQVGDRFTADADSSISVMLANAIELEASNSAVLVIPGTAKVSLLGGLLRAIINFATGGGRNFEVHTPNAAVAARGTDFSTAYEEGMTRRGFSGCERFTDVAVFEGTVGVSQAATPNAPEQMVSAGYETTIACGLPPLSPGPLGLTGASIISGGGGRGGPAIGALAPAPVGAPPPSCPVCPPMR